MRYHYQVVSSVDPTDIYATSQTNPENDKDGSFESETEADDKGEEKRNLIPYGYKDIYYVKTYPVAENIEEQDMLDGNMYPGHEMWNDNQGS